MSIFKNCPQADIETSLTVVYSVTDVLVANLAVADFLFTAFCPIWAVERYKQGQWIIVRVELIEIPKFWSHHFETRYKGFNP